MKYLLPALIFFLFCDLYFPQQRIELIDKKMIQLSGIRRLSDLLYLIPQWHLTTIDGFRWQAAPKGTSSYNNQNWVLMLNGNRINPDIFDVKNINYLPIVLHDIDSVEYIISNQIYHGEFVETGVINIYSKRKENFLSAGYSTGNKIDDPGPFLYTPYKGPNVEETGPDYSLSFGAVDNRFSGAAGFNIYSHASSDIEIYGRQDIPFDNLLVYTFSPNLQLNADFENSNHNFYSGLTTTYFRPFKENRGSDLIFFRPFGKEIPVNSTFFHSGISGRFIINEDYTLRYKTHYSINRIEKPYEEYLYDFDWKLNSLFTNAELLFKMWSLDNTVGIGIENTGLNSRYLINKNNITLYKIYNKLGFSLIDRTEQSFNIFLIGDNSALGLKTSLANQWYFDKKHLLNTSLSFIETIPGENNNYFSWMERGYKLPDSLDLDYNILRKLNKSTRIAAGAGISSSWSESFFSDVSITFSSLNNIFLEKEIYDFDPVDFSFSSPAVLHTDIRGNVFNTEISLNYLLGPVLKQQLNYLSTKSFSGSEIFKDEWNKIPVHKLSYMITYFPAESYSLWGKLEYLSSIEWYEYVNVTAQSGGLYKSEISERFVFDASFQKWIWDKRLRFSLLFKNIFNNKMKYHPLGINFGFSMHLQVMVSF